MKKFAALALVGLLAGMISAPAEAAKKAPKGPVVVGTDPAGDWGTNADPGLAGSPLGDVLGQDLVGAAMEMSADKKAVNFIFQLNALPPSGGMPEFTRYTWDFTVDGSDTLELDGKFTNYSRGACDPTSGQCPPPRDPGMQPFLVRGNCAPQDLTATTLTICEELARVQAMFDAAAATITVAVPLEAISAKPGSKITGAMGTFDQTVNAAPSGFLTMSGFPMDGLITTKTFVVPRR